MFSTTTKRILSCKNLLKPKQINLTKTQIFREIYHTAAAKQHQKVQQQSLKTFVTTKTVNGFKRQQQIQTTETAAGVAASSSSSSLTSWPYLGFINKQTPCQVLYFLKNRTLLAFLETSQRSCVIINKLNYNSFTMVTAEEAVKYLEIPDKSENDKKHYK